MWVLDMNYTIIDRRKNGKGKSIPNRQRFLKRVSKNIKEMMHRSIRNGKISDIATGSGGKVRVPVRDVKEPTIHHGRGGLTQRVLPYNRSFIEGDRIPRPPSGGQGQGSGAGGDGEGEDSFTFSLTKDEFLNYFFEDLELPDMADKQINIVEEYKYRRAGFSCSGNPARLDILRSMREAVGRRLALSAKDRGELRKLKAELVVVNQEIFEATHAGDTVTDLEERRAELLIKILEIKSGIRIPFVDDMDLRFRQWRKEPVPATQAVMFCVMDVSASMSEWHKDLAKRFFMLLYLFLYRSYERIELVFIRHHTEAREVNEKEFFHDRDTGGTMVSAGLELLIQIAKERYNRSQWNIYVAHASDGDAWGDDILATQEHFREILKMSQYYFYIEVSKRDNSELMDALCSVAGSNFATAQVSDASEIYPVFRGLFEKRS